MLAGWVALQDVVSGTTWIRVSVTPEPPVSVDDAVTVTGVVDVTLKHGVLPHVVKTAVPSFATNPTA